MAKSTVEDVFKVSKYIRKLKNNHLKLTFVPLVNMEECKIVVFSDASHSSKTKEISQEGHAIFLVDAAGNANLIRWKSKKVSRVCKSTIAAETLALLEAADTAYFLKLLYEDLLGTKKKIRIECYTDNKSLVQNLDTSNTVSDFRLRVDIARLREMLSTKEVSKVYWIDTKKQIADCLTKQSNGPNLIKAINSNRLLF